MRLRHFSAVAIIVISCAVVFAQQPENGAQEAQQQNSAKDCMPGMAMPGCPETAQAVKANLAAMQPSSFVEKIASHTGSGTSVEPVSTPTSMWMSMQGK